MDTSNPAITSIQKENPKLIDVKYYAKVENRNEVKKVKVMSYKKAVSNERLSRT